MNSNLDELDFISEMFSVLEKRLAKYQDHLKDLKTRSRKFKKQLLIAHQLTDELNPPSSDFQRKT